MKEINKLECGDIIYFLQGNILKIGQVLNCGTDIAEPNMLSLKFKVIESSIPFDKLLNQQRYIPNTSNDFILYQYFTQRLITTNLESLKTYLSTVDYNITTILNCIYRYEQTL